MDGSLPCRVPQFGRLLRSEGLEMYDIRVEMGSGFCVASYGFEGLDGGVFFFVCDIF